MRYWLMKTEPDGFSIDDLKRRKREPWSGVRNYQARNMMRDDMQPGDPVLIYHSSCEIPGVAGIGEVASDPYPDPTQFDRKSDYFDPRSTRETPRWMLVDVAFRRKFREVVSLDRLKEQKALADMVALKRGNRLSITPVTKREFECIANLETKA